MKAFSTLIFLVLICPAWSQAVDCSGYLLPQKEENTQIRPVQEYLAAGVERAVKIHPDFTEVKPVVTNAEKDGAKGLRIIGWVLIGLGLLTLLIISILAGGLLMLLGLLFVLLGGSKEVKAGQMEDVVYLKDGSVIRGTIIEQVPGESLKIKTKDGSIFVYKMEEVEKITKED